MIAKLSTAQIVGLSSSEFGLANMIWAAVVQAKVRCSVVAFGFEGILTFYLGRRLFSYCRKDGRALHSTTNRAWTTRT